ncbi:Clp1-domain-containing protein [Clavulina sp. PMI_390]|nr:Clp1-domain-containing protein [Clavulina sp. PMI_390]
MDQAPDFNEWSLEPNAEYRFELEADASLAVKLVQGSAEVFGAEMAIGHYYLFGAELKSAVFSWQGCTLEITAAEYVSDETPMVPYMNLHLALEQTRVLASRASRNSPPPSSNHDHANAVPPRVLIIGPENSGKTSVTKILTNYAVRSPASWTPIVANLDTNDGGFTVPGTVSAASIASPLLASSPSSSLGSTATTAPTASASSLLPLVHWFGYDEARQSPNLLRRRVQDLAEQVEQRMQRDDHARVSGLIIDSSAAFSSAAPFGPGGEQKYPLIQMAVEAFRVNMIVVVGHERLHVEMQRLFGAYSGSDTGITIVKVPKSGGVVELDEAYRERVHTHQLRSYFYGTPLYLPKGMKEADLGDDAVITDMTLAPHSSIVSFDDLTIYRLGGDTMAPSSALPIGSAPVISEMKPVKIDPSQPGSGLLNTLLAILTPIPAKQITPAIGLDSSKPTVDTKEASDEDILARDVAGFVIVQSLDVARRKMTILAPSPGPLAGKIAIAGGFEWQDE